MTCKRANLSSHLLCIFNLVFIQAHSTIRTTTAFDNFISMWSGFIHRVLAVGDIRNLILSLLFRKWMYGFLFLYCNIKSKGRQKNNSNRDKKNSTIHSDRLQNKYTNCKRIKNMPVLDKLLEYKRNWIQHVNKLHRNRLSRVMKHYSPTGRRNHHGRLLKRLLDTWDWNGLTSGPTPWQIHDDDYNDGDDDVKLTCASIPLNGDENFLIFIVRTSVLMLYCCQNERPNAVLLSERASYCCIVVRTSVLMPYSLFLIAC
jgi:hypothetical protein